MANMIDQANNPLERILHFTVAEIRNLNMKLGEDFIVPELLTRRQLRFDAAKAAGPLRDRTQAYLGTLKPTHDSESFVQPATLNRYLKGKELKKIERELDRRIVSLAWALKVDAIWLHAGVCGPFGSQENRPWLHRPLSLLALTIRAMAMIQIWRAVQYGACEPAVISAGPKPEAVWIKHWGTMFSHTPAPTLSDTMAIWKETSYEVAFLEEHDRLCLEQGFGVIKQSGISLWQVFSEHEVEVRDAWRRVDVWMAKGPPDAPSQPVIQLFGMARHDLPDIQFFKIYKALGVD